MKKDRILHFVGFVTDVEPEDFVPQWEEYAGRFGKKNKGIILQQEQGTQYKSRFKYFSRHISDETEIRFAFMKGRNSEQFREQKVKVVQAGGYQPLQTGNGQSVQQQETRILVFAGSGIQDLGLFRQLPHRSLDIYEAYYENCLFSHVLELIVKDTTAPETLGLLKQLPGIEFSPYRECLVPFA